MINYDSRYMKCLMNCREKESNKYKENVCCISIGKNQFNLIRSPYEPYNLLYGWFNGNNHYLEDFTIEEFVPMIYEERKEEYTIRIISDKLFYENSIQYEDIFYMSIIMSDLKHVEHLLKFINIYQHGLIDELIRMSIDMEKHEIQVMLTDFKYKHNLFTEKKWEL